jgi:hypothetical protein
MQRTNRRAYGMPALVDTSTSLCILGTTLGVAVPS